jgi:hypothetical protein
MNEPVAVTVVDKDSVAIGEVVFEAGYRERFPQGFTFTVGDGRYSATWFHRHGVDMLEIPARIRAPEIADVFCNAIRAARDAG